MDSTCATDPDLGRSKATQRLVNHVLFSESADLVYSLTIYKWDLNRCRQHPIYWAVELQWLTTPTLAVNPDRLFLDLLAKLFSPDVLLTLHPSLQSTAKPRPEPG